MELFESSLRSHPACRPHWTKGHFATSEVELARMFGSERLDRWRAIRDRVDPDRVMWSEWLEERVGSSSAGRAKAVVPAEEKRSGRWEDVMGQAGGFQLPFLV